jgi:hypothetical protein
MSTPYTTRPSRRSRRCAQIMSSKSPVRSCADVDETAVRPDRA